MSKKIFSGVQPTGNLHLGNYLGAIKNFVGLNNDKENDCIFCVVDLHAITVKQNPKELRKNIRETVAEENGKIVGSTTLLIEQKFIHNGGRVGHIEDVVVSKEFEGRGIGIKLVTSLLKKAEEMKCYKTILDCEEKLIPFYEKIGLDRKSVV